jgi:hypothetical protein
MKDEEEGIKIKEEPNEELEEEQKQDESKQ